MLALTMSASLGELSLEGGYPVRNRSDAPHLPGRTTARPPIEARRHSEGGLRGPARGMGNTASGCSLGSRHGTDGVRRNGGEGAPPSEVMPVDGASILIHYTLEVFPQNLLIPQRVA